MYLSFAEHILECRSWETKGDMIDFLTACNVGSLILGEEAEQEVGFYSVIVHFNYSATNQLESVIPPRGQLGIGICSETHGVKPHLLLLPEKHFLVFGFNKEVVGVNTINGNISFRIVFDYSPFRSFIHLREIMIVLAFHEIGAIALTEEGQQLWKYDKDIITGCVIENQNLHITFADSSSATINIMKGSVIANE